MEVGWLALGTDVTFPSKRGHCDGVLTPIVRQVVTDASVHVSLQKGTETAHLKGWQCLTSRAPHTRMKQHLRLQLKPGAPKLNILSGMICSLKPVNIPTYSSIGSTSIFHLGSCCMFFKDDNPTQCAEKSSSTLQTSSFKILNHSNLKVLFISRIW